jgi:hypothetical protein
MAEHLRGRSGLSPEVGAVFPKYGVRLISAQEQMSGRRLVAVHHHVPCFPSVLKSLCKNDFVPEVYVAVPVHHVHQHRMPFSLRNSAKSELGTNLTRLTISSLAGRETTHRIDVRAL